MSGLAYPREAGMKGRGGRGSKLSMKKKIEKKLIQL
jgi:hypothetical protein